MDLSRSASASFHFPASASTEPRAQHHGVAGQGSYGFVEVGLTLLGIDSLGGAANQGLGPQRRVVVGLLDRLVERRAGLFGVTAGQVIQLGDLVFGLRLLGAELQTLLQIGEGRAAVSQPAVVGLSAGSSQNGTVDLAGFDVAALRVGGGQQSVGYGLVALVEALFHGAFTELDHVGERVAGALGEFLLLGQIRLGGPRIQVLGQLLGGKSLFGGLVQIGLALVFRAGRKRKDGG